MIKWILERKFIPRIDWDKPVNEFTFVHGFLFGVIGVVVGHLICYF